MNDALARVLVQLSDPGELEKFHADRDAYIRSVDLPPLDKEILKHADRNLLRLHARFGSVTPELLAAVRGGEATDKLNAALNMHEHLFEFEHDEDVLECDARPTHSFGPHSRMIDD